MTFAQNAPQNAPLAQHLRPSLSERRPRALAPKESRRRECRSPMKAEAGTSARCPRPGCAIPVPDATKWQKADAPEQPLRDQRRAARGTRGPEQWRGADQVASETSATQEIEAAREDQAAPGPTAVGAPTPGPDKGGRSMQWARGRDGFSGRGARLMASAALVASALAVAIAMSRGGETGTTEPRWGPAPAALSSNRPSVRRKSRSRLGGRGRRAPDSQRRTQGPQRTPRRDARRRARPSADRPTSPTPAAGRHRRVPGCAAIPSPLAAVPTLPRPAPEFAP